MKGKNMNLHGKTTIKIYDKETNEINTIREDNMVTDAYKNILSPNSLIGALENNFPNLGVTYTPIFGLFGGLLIFDEEVESNTIIPTKNEFDHFVGCVSGSYNGSSVVRGSLNTQKSEYTNTYIKEVFDFDLEKINHNIKTISLTSAAGGNCGLNKLDEEESSFLASYGYDKLGEKSTKCRVSPTSPNNFLPYVLRDIDGTLLGTNTNGNIVVGTKNETTLTIKIYEQNQEIGFTDLIRKPVNIADFLTTFGGKIENLGILKLKETKTFDITSTNLANLEEFTILGDHLYSCKNVGSNFICYDFDLESNSYVYGTIETDITDTIIYSRMLNKDLYITSETKLYDIKFTNDLTQGGIQTGIYSTIELLQTNLCPIPFKNTVMLIPTSAVSENEIVTIYFLTSNNTLLKQQLKYGNATSGQPFRGICFNFNEPLIGLIGSGNSDGHNFDFLSVNVVTPYLSTINVLSTSVYKPATSILEVTYELSMS